MATTLKYDLLVQRLMKESEEKRMHKTTTLTPEQCAAEIAEITGLQERIDATPPGGIVPVTKHEMDVIATHQLQPRRKGGWPKGKPRGKRK